jgi:hypothetical protein
LLTWGGVTICVRFEFHNTRFATVDRRHKCQNLADSALAFKFFQSKIAPSIVESYRFDYDSVRFQFRILIFNLVSVVTASIDYPSGSKIIFSDEEIASMEQFYFYSLPPSLQPWGYSSADDRPTGPQDIKDATISSDSYVYT